MGDAILDSPFRDRYIKTGIAVVVEEVETAIAYYGLVRIEIRTIIGIRKVDINLFNRIRI